MKSNPENLPMLVSNPAHSLSQLVQAIVHAVQPEPETESALPLSHFLWILKRHRWKVAAFVTSCVFVTTVVSIRLIPIYEATATIDVDRQTPQGIVGAEANRSAANDADQFLATQMKLLESDAVLRPVVNEYRLEQKPSGAHIDPAASIAQRDAPVVLKKLRITRPQNTYLLQVSYRSPDPKVAANVSNAIAKSYIAHIFDLRYRAASSQSVFMEKQIEELRAKMERSSNALAQFEKVLNFINPEEKTSILSARLLQLNEEYTTSQGERMKKQAEYLSLKEGSVEAALASPQGEALRKYSEHLDDMQEKFALVGGQYGSNHPEYRKAARQLAEVQRLFEQSRQKLVASVNAQFRQASNRESMLSKAVDETKSEFDKLNAHSFEYSQLRREADADKKLYEELTRRIKEAGINASFQNSSIRLADLARPAEKPMFPNIPLNIILAFVFSLLGAVLAAVLSDVLDNTVRDADALSRALNVQVIGSLPLVSNWRKRISPVIEMASATVTGNQPGDLAMAGFRESVRTLRNTLLLADMDRRLRSILVTSASPSEGKSTTAVHLALAHAEQGNRTLLVDCDLRRPSIHQKFGFNPKAGLSSVLLGELEWDAALVKPEGIPSLHILPAGPPAHRAVATVGAGLGQLLTKISSQYDLVIVDAPPMLGFAESLEMSASIDGVLIVARVGATQRKALAAAVQTLKRLNVKILGLVINEVAGDSSDTHYYYQADKTYYTPLPRSA